MKKPIEAKIDRLLKMYRVKPRAKLRLNTWSADDDMSSFLKKKGGKELAEKLRDRLDRFQEVLYAEHKHKVLIVLQGMDTAGKDGTIRHVFRGVNPQGVRVAAFKVPTQEESDHDYLWRIHRQMPRKGEIVIFNRSHYEDVVTTRVHGLIGPKECACRYRQIHDFERMLSEEGTVILKFFLHIDKNEQSRRLEEREDEPDKNWKLSVSDFKERKFWPAYVTAYEEALSATSSQVAPWFVIPSNKKSHRNLTISWQIVETLRRLDPKYPKRAD